MQLQPALQPPSGRAFAYAGVILGLTGIFVSVTFFMVNPPFTLSFEHELDRAQSTEAATEQVPAGARFAERRAAVLEALEGAPSEEWSGVYSYAEEDRSRTVLAWSPRAGFALWQPDGVAWQAEFDFGQASFEGGLLELVSDRARPHGAGRRFFAVRWGGRRYLVPSDRMINFCEAARYRLTDGLKRFALKEGGGEQSLPPGPPDVPEEYHVFLHRSRLLQ